MATKPKTPQRPAAQAAIPILIEDANDWTETSVALMGPAPFLDPFARARREAHTEASA